MITRLLIILLAFSSLPVGQNNENLIPWNSEKRLNWEDFKGNPPAEATNAALTSSSIIINFTYSNESLRYQVSCAFDKNRSWGRIKNDHILAHEQGHFDITELHARKLFKNLKEYQFRRHTVSKDINLIYNKVVQDLQEMQSGYDNETDHSRNFAAQKEWQSKIAEELAMSKNYADYGK